MFYGKLMWYFQGMFSSEITKDSLVQILPSEKNIHIWFTKIGAFILKEFCVQPSSLGYASLLNSKPLHTDIDRV